MIIEENSKSVGGLLVRATIVDGYDGHDDVMVTIDGGGCDVTTIT